MYLVIPWLTHGYALHLKINTSGSFSPVSAISPQFLPFLPGRKVFLPFSPQFLPMAGEKYLSAGEKANPGWDQSEDNFSYTGPLICIDNIMFYVCFISNIYCIN